MDYAEPQKRTSPEDKLKELLGLMKAGWLVVQYVPKSASAESTVDSSEPMHFEKDGFHDDQMEFPDPSQVMELRVRGLLDFRIKQHPSNRSFDVRTFVLTEKAHEYLTKSGT